jgi:HK97 family phage prohead protease
MADGSGSFEELKQLLKARDAQAALPPSTGPTSRMMAIRAIREGAREVDFICSTESVDSYGTILEQDWDLTRFSANPVVLYSHDSRELPIGQARAIEVEGAGAGRQLVATIWFSDVTALARDVWKLVLEKTLRGISVGFDFKSYRIEERDGVEVVVLFGLELIELSITPTPANGDCLSQLRTRAMAPSTTRSGAVPSPNSNTSPTAALSAEKEPVMALLTDDEIKSLQARNAELAARATELETASKKVIEERDATTQRLASITSERDAAVQRADAADKLVVSEKKRADDAEAQVNALEVRSLVGKKITPAEEAEFVELRSTNKPLFDKMVDKRSDMPHGTTVISEAPNGTPPPAVDTRASAQAELDALNAKVASKG